MKIREMPGRCARWIRNNPRTAAMRLMGWLHCGLVLGTVCQAFHPLTPIVPSFFRGFLIAIPVAVSLFAVKHLRQMWQVLLAGLGTAALAWLLMGSPIGAGITVPIYVFRIRARMAEETRPALFETPNVGFLVVFLVIFLVSAVYAWPEAQRLSVITAVVYLLLLLAFLGLRKIDDYLVLNQNMHGLPARRIQRTAGIAVAAGVLLAGALLLPLARNFSGQVTMDTLSSYDKGKQEAAMELEQQYMDASGQAILAQVDPTDTFHMPQWVSYLLYVVAIGFAVLVLGTALYQFIRNFRFSFSDSQDQVRFLSDEDRNEGSLPHEKRDRRRPPIWDRTPNAQVRRLYRKAVLKATPDQPKYWQSPEELEAAAGLTIPELHRLYEKARYGQEPCTADDLRILREKT